MDFAGQIGSYDNHRMSAATFFLRMRSPDEAVDFIETVRWGDKPICPYCEALRVSRHQSADRSTPRWQCSMCHRAFAVTVGTLMQNTRVDLRSWLAIASYTLKPTRPLSTRRIAALVSMGRTATVWSIQDRIRKAGLQGSDDISLIQNLVDRAEHEFKEQTVLR